MATIKQEKAIGKLVENGGNVSKAMKEAGYSEATAKNPSKLTKSKGFEELLDEYGLTEELIVTALVEDITKKPQNRKAELELGSKLRGMIVDKKDITSKGDKVAIAPLIVSDIGGESDGDKAE